MVVFFGFNLVGEKGKSGESRNGAIGGSIMWWLFTRKINYSQKRFIPIFR